MRQRRRFFCIWTVFLPAMLLAALIAAACGGQARSGGSGGEAAPATQGREARVVSTMPPLQMAQPTTMIDATRVAELHATPSPQQTIDVELGGRVYTRLCVECHGAEGEGVPDKGKAVAGVEMDAAALSTLLRTGGKLGPDHLFGLDKVSPEGVKALHAWMQTLPAPE